MLKISLTICALWLCAVTNAQSLLIENVTVISAERNQPLMNANVFIKNGVIKEISQTRINSPTMLKSVDATGKFLIPGLIDSHVHVSSMPGIPMQSPLPVKLQKLKSQFLKQQPRSYLYYGITQLVDPSQSAEAISHFNSAPQKPVLFHCGAVPILNGYPTFWVEKQNRIDAFRYLIVDQNNHSQIPSHRKAEEFEPESVVKRIKDDGGICVKVFIEDGFGSAKDWPLISHSLLNRIKQAAQKHKLIFMAHANAIDMQQIAQAVDVDVIAHGLWNWNQFDGQRELPTNIKNILDNIVKQDIVYQTTFNVMDSLKGVTVDKILQQDGFSKIVPSDILAWYQTPEGEWFKQEMLAGFKGLTLRQIHKRQDSIIKQGELAAQYLNTKGHPFVLASDTPPAPTFASQPGLSTFKELQHLAQIGVSLKRIFEAATINNAKAFNLAEHYATVEPGKIANLLILNKNPLETIDAYDSIDAVILSGQVIPRKSLLAD